MTVLGRRSRMTAARRSLCCREGCTSESGTPRVPRHLTASSLAALAASLARISGVPRVPISPAVRSRIPVLYPRCAIFSNVPPQVSSTSSGCAAMANRSRFILPPECGDCRVGEAFLSALCKVAEVENWADKSARPARMCYGFKSKDDGRRQKGGEVVAGSRGACDGGRETARASGSVSAGGGGRERGCALPFVSGGGAVGSRRDREIWAAGLRDCRRFRQRCGDQAAF